MLNIGTAFKPATLCLAIMQIALLAPTPAVAGDQDFVLVNKTGVEIHQLNLSPHKSNEWGPDILGQDTLSDGERLKIHFQPSEVAHWDLRIADKQGNTVVWENLNLLEISEVSIFIRDGQAVAEFR
jgi:hypothetical protein